MLWFPSLIWCWLAEGSRPPRVRLGDVVEGAVRKAGVVEPEQHSVRWTVVVSVSCCHLALGLRRMLLGGSCGRGVG